LTTPVCNHETSQENSTIRMTATVINKRLPLLKYRECPENEMRFCMVDKTGVYRKKAEIQQAEKNVASSMDELSFTARITDKSETEISAVDVLAVILISASKKTEKARTISTQIKGISSVILTGTSK
jgi:aspartate oxidase